MALFHDLMDEKGGAKNEILRLFVKKTYVELIQESFCFKAPLGLSLYLTFANEALDWLMGHENLMRKGCEIFCWHPYVHYK